MKLEEIATGTSLDGVEPGRVVTVVAAVSIPPDSLQLVYRLPEGGIRERLLTRSEEPGLTVATITRPWSFDGDGASFQLAAEAKRIDLAFLFDPMMAVHTSNVDPLPHQITAVYESLLPRQPLRYVLADDPGAGKTIMAGLYIRELIMRGDARHILIIDALQADKSHLAIVLVGENDSTEGPYYLQDQFDTEPGWAEASRNLNLAPLMERAKVAP